MKYYSPELLIAGASADPVVARQSDLDWEEASQRYLDELEYVLYRAPAGVRASCGPTS